MIPIEPTYKDTNNCLQNVLSGVLCWKKIDPIFLYLDSWNFGYENKNNLFGNSIFPSRDNTWYNKNTFEILKECYGIKIAIREVNDFLDFLDEVREELKRGDPVCIELDVFLCEWHIAYEVYHLPHSCLIVDADDFYLYCLIQSNHKEKSIGKIELSKLKNNVYKYMLFDFSNLKKEKYDLNVKKFLKRSAQRTLCRLNDSRSDFCVMRECANNMENNLILKNEMSDIKDVWAIPLIRCFDWVVWSRKNYFELLNSFVNLVDNNILLETIDEFENIVKNWTKLKNILIKNILVNPNHFNVKDITEVLFEISEQEELLAQNIINSLGEI